MPSTKNARAVKRPEFAEAFNLKEVLGNNPGVSIVVPAYNEAKFLPATLGAINVESTLVESSCFGLRRSVD